MDFFKLFNIRIHLKTKYKFILIGVIIAIILFNILSNFGFCATEVEIITLNNASLATSGVVELSGSRMGYSYLVKGHNYTFINNSPSNNKYYAFSSVEPYVGLDVRRTAVLPGESYTFTADSDIIIMGNNLYYSLIDNTDTNVGMSGSLKTLITSINQETIGQVFVDSIPYIAIIVFFGFGFFAIVMLIRILRKGE